MVIIPSSYIMLSAPGNFIRQSRQLADKHLTAHTYSLPMQLILSYIFGFFRYGYHILLAFVLIYIAYWVYKNRNTLSKEILIYFTFLLVLLNMYILSFFKIAYFVPIVGRMLIVMDSLIFLIIFKFCAICFANYYKQKIIPVKYKIIFILFALFIFGYITISYYFLHQFIINRQSLINSSSTINSQIKLPGYTASKFFKYPIYFKTSEVPDSSFIQTYLSTKLN